MKFGSKAFDYDRYGQNYSDQRKEDPHIARFIHRALGEAKTIINIGSGTGSYEPKDRYVVAVEPSARMRGERLKYDRAPAIDAKAGSLPFDEKSFDAAMAVLTIHHWPDLKKGLKELRRVTNGLIVILTFDPEALDLFWNARYFPELVAIEQKRYPKIPQVLTYLGGSSEVLNVPIPFNCSDGFQEAYYGRPEAFLHKEVRRAQSAWGFLDDGLEDELVKRLAVDIQSGHWDKKYGDHRVMPYFQGALRLIISKSKPGNI